MAHASFAKIRTTVRQPYISSYARDEACFTPRYHQQSIYPFFFFFFFFFFSINWKYTCIMNIKYPSPIPSSMLCSNCRCTGVFPWKIQRASKRAANQRFPVIDKKIGNVTNVMMLL
jgi:hypothetical protein